jgi:hypothetical protein
MRRLSLANLALLVAVAALAAFVYFRPSREDSAAQPLSARPAGQAALIRIEREGAPAVVVEKRDGRWHLSAPLSAEADTFQIERLLAVRSARPVQRFPASNLERFELDRPRLRLVIDDEAFAFGMVNAVSGEQYVLVREAVYAIDPGYGAALPVDGMQLARKQLLSGSAIPVRFDMGQFVVEQKAGQWLLRPAPATLSQDELARWVENWRFASALRVAPRGANPALMEMRVDLQSGASVKLAILARAPELVIARDDEKLQYHFPAAIAQRLLQPPGTAVAEPAQRK